MKSWLSSTFILAMAALALSGCEKKLGETTVSTRASGPRASLGAVNNSLAAQAQLRGMIGADPSYQDAFQSAVLGFLSTDVNSQYVGTVSASGQGGSGVRFGGRVQLATGTLRTMTGGNNSIATNSTLSIQVIDSVPNAANTPPLPPFNFSQAAGYISSTQAQITFSDTYGSITFNGTLNTGTNMFTGSVSYDNNVMLDGTRPGAAGNLGNFQIAICDFFICN